MFNKIALIFICLFLTSCLKKIELELETSETRLVAEGNFTTEYKFQTVKLTKTSGYFSNTAAPVISGATVIIESNDSSFNFTENPIGSGIYQSDIKVKASVGQTYKLKISNVNLSGTSQSYEALSGVKNYYNIDSISYIKYKNNSDVESYVYGFDTTKTVCKITLWGNEPNTLEDFYQWDIYVNGVLKTDNMNRIIIRDDKIINGNNFKLADVFMVNADIGDTITVASQSIGKDYFNFVNLFKSSAGSSNGGAFTPPPANVPTNLSNGGLGFFRATATSFKSIIVK